MVERTSLSGKTDPDAETKDAAEEELAVFFAEQLALQADDLFNELDADNPESPTGEFWEKWAAIFLAFLIPAFQAQAIEAAETQFDTLQIGVSFEAVILEAANFSRTHAFNLVSDLNLVTQNHLQNALQAFFESPDKDIENLKNQLAATFGTARAENIAITEVTRGFEAGKRIYADQLAEQGIRTDFLWHTLQDERVCVICEPNDLVFRSEGWTVAEIPAHPRDRCWTTIEIITG